MITVLAKDTIKEVVEIQLFRILLILWNAAEEKFGSCLNPKLTAVLLD
jgi:hypothetical protein